MSEKEKQEISKKPTSEVKRLHQNDQEKQRKEKIKACIGEIAKELPPQAEQLDRKPSTLYIVLQTKEYIQKLKKQIQGYETNLVAEQQQEELRQLREAHNSDLERIRKLEEMVKNSAIEKVTRVNSNDLPSTTSHHSDGSASGRRRSKTVNKLFTEKSEMLHQPMGGIEAPGGSLSSSHHLLNASALSSSSSSSSSSSVFSGGGSTTTSTPYSHNNTGSLPLPPPPSLLVSQQPTSNISIMTVAPTILSVKSPSLGQSSSRSQNNMADSSGSNGGSGGVRLTSSTTVSSSSSVSASNSSLRGVNHSEVRSGAMSTSYPDVAGMSNYGNAHLVINSTNNADGSLSAIAHSSSSSSSTSSSVSSNSETAHAGVIGLPTLMGNNNSNNGSSGVNNSIMNAGVGNGNNSSNLVIGSHPYHNHLTAAELATAGIHTGPGSILNLAGASSVVGSAGGGGNNSNNQQEMTVGPNSALQTLASVAASTHMATAAVTGCGDQALCNPLVVSLSGQQQQQHQQQQHHQSPIMSLAQQQQQQMSDGSIGAVGNNLKQVIVNGQLLTVNDPALVPFEGGDGGNANNMLPIVPPQSQPINALGINPQPSTNLNMGQGGHIFNPGGLQPAQHQTVLPNPNIGNNGNNTIIYTLNEQGQLVAVQNAVNPVPSSMTSSTSSISSSTPSSSISSTATGNFEMIPNFLQQSSSIQQQHHNLPQQYLSGPSNPIVSLGGPMGQHQPNQAPPQILLPPTANPLQQVLPQAAPFLFPQQQQQQVLSLGGLGGVQIINPFTGMVVNNMGPLSAQQPTAAAAGPLTNTVKLIGNDVKLVPPGDHSVLQQGPTHVMVDGSLIPISTNPQTIVPAGAPLAAATAVAPKQQQIPVGNPILQFDPNNPSAPPILLNAAAAGGLQITPTPGQLLGPSLQPGGPPGIIQVASGAPVIGGSLAGPGISTIPLGNPAAGTGPGGMMVVSSIVANTVTTNSVATCISSVNASTGSNSKVGKALPSLAPALAVGPTPSSTISQKATTNSRASSKSNSRRNKSPSVARTPPFVTSEVAPQIMQQQSIPNSNGSTKSVIPILSPLKNSTADDTKTFLSSVKGRSLSSGRQDENNSKRKNSTPSSSTADLLAQATATAGILMDSSELTQQQQQTTSCGNSVGPASNGGVNNNNNMNQSLDNSGNQLNISGSSTGELQINLKSSPGDDEEDNIQLIIDENCVGGSHNNSSTSPAHAAGFSPKNINVTPPALTVKVSPSLSSPSSSSLFKAAANKHSLVSPTQPLRMQMPGIELITPVVSPNITPNNINSPSASSSSTAAEQRKQQQHHQQLLVNAISSISSLSSNNSTSNLQLLSPMSSSVMFNTSSSSSSSSTSSITSVSSFLPNESYLPSSVQLVGGPFRSDVFTQLVNTNNTTVSAKTRGSDSGKNTKPASSLDSSNKSTSSLSSTSINHHAPLINASPFVSIAPTPVCVVGAQHQALSAPTTAGPFFKEQHNNSLSFSSGSHSNSSSSVSSVSHIIPVVTPVANEKVQPKSKRSRKTNNNNGQGGNDNNSKVDNSNINTSLPSMPSISDFGVSGEGSNSTIAAGDVITMISATTGSSEPDQQKKKAAPKKRKTRAELKMEREEMERAKKAASDNEAATAAKVKKMSEVKVSESSYGSGMLLKGAPEVLSKAEEDSLLAVLEASDNEAVKEQILNSVNESKLLNPDGNLISLMDVVDNIESLASQVEDEENGGGGNGAGVFLIKDSVAVAPDQMQAQQKQQQKQQTALNKSIGKGLSVIHNDKSGGNVNSKIQSESQNKVSKSDPAIVVPSSSPSSLSLSFSTSSSHPTTVTSAMTSTTAIVNENTCKFSPLTAESMMMTTTTATTLQAPSVIGTATTAVTGREQRSMRKRKEPSSASNVNNRNTSAMKNDSGVSSNKRARKAGNSSASLKQQAGQNVPDLSLFGMNEIHASNAASASISSNNSNIDNDNQSSVLSSSASVSSSDIYDFVDEDDAFLQPPPTPSRSPAKKPTRKGKGKANSNIGSSNDADSKSTTSLATPVGVTTRSSDAASRGNAKSVTNSSNKPEDGGSYGRNTNVNNPRLQPLNVSVHQPIEIQTSSPTVSLSSSSSSKSKSDSGNHNLYNNLSTPVSISTNVSSTGNSTLSAFSASLEMISPPLPAQSLSSSSSSSTSALSLPSSSFSSSVSNHPITSSSLSNMDAPATLPTSQIIPITAIPPTISTSDYLPISTSSAPSSSPMVPASGADNMINSSSNMSNNFTNNINNNLVRKQQTTPPDNSENLGPTLEESFSMDFPVMDFQSSPKLEESHDDSISAEAIADFFNQESPGKINFHSSPPNLGTNVLSPSDVDLPALRTPAPPDSSNNTDSGMMMNQGQIGSGMDKGGNMNSSSLSSTASTTTSSSLSSPSQSASIQLMQTVPSRMHTPTPDRKSPIGGSMMDSSGSNNISTSAPPILTMPSSAVTNQNSNSMVVPPPPLRSCQSTGGGMVASKNTPMGGFGLTHPSQTMSMGVMDSTSSAEGPIPSLSSSSLDALPEIIPLKPITSEIQAEAEAAAAAAAAAVVAAANNSDRSQMQQCSGGQVQSMPHHGVMPPSMSGGDMSMVMAGAGTHQHQQQQQQQHHQLQQQVLPDVQQQHSKNAIDQQRQQQQQQQQPQHHFTPQSSPHNLRPPSASSTTPLPSPKLHASPGSASNPGSVHGMSMSPAAQQQQQHPHHQQIPSPMDRSSVPPPLSHPPPQQQQPQQTSQMYPPPLQDSSPRNPGFGSPPGNLKMKHMSPSAHSVVSDQQQPFKNYPNGPSPSLQQQQQKGQYSVENIMDHQAAIPTSGAGTGPNNPRMPTGPNENPTPNNSSGYNTMASASPVPTVPPISGSNSVPVFPLQQQQSSQPLQQQQPLPPHHHHHHAPNSSSCNTGPAASNKATSSANANNSNKNNNTNGSNNGNNNNVSAAQTNSRNSSSSIPPNLHQTPAIPPIAVPSHSSPYASPFFPPPPATNPIMHHHPTLQQQQQQQQQQQPPSSTSSSSSTSPAASSSSQHLNMHPVGNMEIQHPSPSTHPLPSALPVGVGNPSVPPSNPDFHLHGVSSLMTYNNQPKLNIPPIARSPSYNANATNPPTAPHGNNGNNAANNNNRGNNRNMANNNNSSNNNSSSSMQTTTGKSPSSGNNSSYSSSVSKNNMDGGNNNSNNNSNNNRYPGNNSNNNNNSSSSNNNTAASNNKHSAEAIYQQQQKRPNTIQHPPTPISHHHPHPHSMDPMSRLAAASSTSSSSSSSTTAATSHPNFFPMGFPPPPTASSSSSSMPLRHLPDTRDVPSRSPYDYPVTPHPSMGFPPHPHSSYGHPPPHSHFGNRDCSHLQLQLPQSSQQQPPQPPPQQQHQQQPQQQQQSPRKPNTPKKSSSSSSNNSSSGSSSSNRNSSCSNNSNANGGNSNSSSNSLGPPARSAPSHHHSNNHHNSSTSSSSSSSSNNHSSSSSNNRSSTQKRKNTSSNSSSSSSNNSSSSTSSSSSRSKKNTASQHTGFPSEMDPSSMSAQSMFDPSFPYLNFPTLAQSMSPPAARPHQSDTPFLGSMFNTPTRPISNSSAKTADMASTFPPLFPTRAAQNSFLQPSGFGMNSMTGNHGNAATGISPHSMAAVGSHMNPFGIFGNDGGAGADNIAAASNKFLHATNPILPSGAHQGMDTHSLQHGHHHQTSALYHNRPHSAQPHHMMPTMAFYPHGFDSRSHMGQFNGSAMGHHHHHPFPAHGLPPINFSMHESH